MSPIERLAALIPLAINIRILPPKHFATRISESPGAFRFDSLPDPFPRHRKAIHPSGGPRRNSR